MYISKGLLIFRNSWAAFFLEFGILKPPLQVFKLRLHLLSLLIYFVDLDVVYGYFFGVVEEVFVACGQL